MTPDTSARIAAEVSALRRMAERTTPIGTWPAALSSPFAEEIKLLQQCRYLIKIRTRGQEMTQPAYDLVRDRYEFPFELRQKQIDIVNNLAPLPRAAEWMWPGTGKTAVSTHCALYRVEACGRGGVLVLVPPHLVTQWVRWLGKVKRKDGRPIKIVEYSGPPTKRKKIPLDGDFIVMALSIFKRDADHVSSELAGRGMVVIVDEAQALKSISTDNHKKVESLVNDGHDFIALSGTPLSTPVDAYAHCKLKSPGLYRNQNQFLNLHVEETDFFGNPEKYQNLDLLYTNMGVNAEWLRREDAAVEMPLVTYTAIPYQLEPKHIKLYHKIADEQLVKLQNEHGDEKLDLTSTQALLHALQQVILNYGHFAGDPSLKPAGFGLVEDVLDELGTGKLMIFGKYQMSNRLMVEQFKKYGAVGFYGEIPKRQQQANADRFIDDPACRVFVAQPQSAGVGLDGFQHVCADAIYMEVPAVTHFTQSVARIDRDGQKLPVNIRVAVAEGTLQVRGFNGLLKKEELINTLTGGVKSLRAAIFGD